MANELSSYEQATRKTSERGVVPPPLPVQDDQPSVLAMAGPDFYHAACVAAHARLSSTSPEVKDLSAV